MRKLHQDENTNFAFEGGQYMKRTLYRKQFTDLLNCPQNKFSSPIKLLNPQECQNSPSYAHQRTDYSQLSNTPKPTKNPKYQGENSTRQRQFTLRVNNIQKMNQKIHSLLQYVGSKNRKFTPTDKTYRSRTPTVSNFTLQSQRERTPKKSSKVDQICHLRHEKQMDKIEQSIKKQKNTIKSYDYKFFQQRKDTNEGGNDELKKEENRNQKYEWRKSYKNEEIHRRNVNKSQCENRNTYGNSENKRQQKRDWENEGFYKRNIQENDKGYMKRREKQCLIQKFDGQDALQRCQQKNRQKKQKKERKNYLAMAQRPQQSEIESENKVSSEIGSYPLQKGKSQFKIKIHPVYCEQDGMKSARSVNFNKKQVMNKKIANCLAEQVRLDKLLRSARQEFENLGGQQKWNQLSEQLEGRGFLLTEEQLKTQIILSDNEIDPFELKKSGVINAIQNLGDAYQQSSIHWEQELSKCCDKQELRQSGFEFRSLDLTGRGYLTIQDIVCFINLYSDKYFRNRDLICLFNRFTNNQRQTGINYQQLQEKISH